MFDLFLQKVELPTQINVYLYSSSVDFLESRSSDHGGCIPGNNSTFPNYTVLCILLARNSSGFSLTCKMCFNLLFDCQGVIYEQRLLFVYRNYSLPLHHLLYVIIYVFSF